MVGFLSLVQHSTALCSLSAPHSFTLSSSPPSVRSFLLSIICVPLRCSFFFVALFWTLPFISRFHFVSVFIPLFLRLFFSREFWTFAFDSAFSKFFGFGGFKRDIFPAAPVLLVAVHSLFFVISFYAALCLSHAQLQQKINNNKNKIKGKVQGEKNWKRNRKKCGKCTKQSFRRELAKWSKHTHTHTSRWRENQPFVGIYLNGTWDALPAHSISENCASFKWSLLHSNALGEAV